MNIKLHIPSVLATLLVVGGAAVLSAQSTVGSLASVFTIREIVVPVTVHSPAHPRDFVRIQTGQPYAVPVGKVLVVQSIGVRRWNQPHKCSLVVDGVAVYQHELGVYPNGAWRPSIQALEPGIAVAAGSLVEAGSDNNNANYETIILGYLADE